VGNQYGDHGNTKRASLVADLARHGTDRHVRVLRRSVLAVLFFAVLLSFTLSPVVQALEYLHIPRATAALISVVALLVLLYGHHHRFLQPSHCFCGQRSEVFAEDPLHPAALPEERGTPRENGRGGRRAGCQERSAVRQVQSWSEVLTHGAGTLPTSCWPRRSSHSWPNFLLTWQSHARSAP